MYVINKLKGKLQHLIENILTTIIPQTNHANVPARQ